MPLGQSESCSYDPNGNLATKTDFNGKTTSYAYDGVNQLLSKAPDPSFGAGAVTFTYTGGRRATMTDASGTTSYGYSAENLQQVNKPAGTLFYSYDLADNVTQLSGGGMTVNYTYDALNRLATVQEGNTGTTSYGYDNVGNLQSVTYPNGVVHAYSYDNRNRLTNLGVAKGASNLASYGYTLDAAGHRTSVAELSGRTVNYTYDNLYRLTNETVAADPANVNGAVSYTYDPVGNRKQMTSTLPGVAAGLWNYDANDRFTAGDGYDANGNTTSSGGITAAYDFENHLIQKGGVTIVYDGDGNRVSKTVAGVKTLYLVDTLNPTGYAQVIAEEAQNTAPLVPYVYGLERISQRRTVVINGNFTTQIRYFDYDGHGSVRALTDPNGAVTDTYDYDAFGNLIHSTGTTQNVYLYSGEQFDPDLNLYYNRARYLNVSTGRFWSMDEFGGRPADPQSLHRYLYGANDPVSRRDPSGHDFIQTIGALAVQKILVTQTIIGAGIGGALGCVGGALDSESRCSQGFFSGILAGAVTGALGGAYLGTAFGASQAGRVLLTLASSGLGGSAAYYAAKRKQYTLAIFYAFTTIGTGWLTLGASASGTSGVAGAVEGGGGGLGRYNFLSQINPAPEPTDMNCVACAIAVDNVLAGDAPSAAPKTGPVDINELAVRYGSQWVQMSISEIESQVAAGGPGTRGIVFGGRSGVGAVGHVFNVENYGGTVNFIDGQAGGAAQTGGYDFYYFLLTSR